MVKRIIAGLLLALIMAVGGVLSSQAQVLTLASTTSTENSGLFGDILPRFTKDTGIAVRVVAVGTGAALNLGRQGDADVLLVHSRTDEDKFVADGFGPYRRDMMYNDFAIVGPKIDPAGIKGTHDAAAALAAIAKSGSTFVSRGDDSGTHKAERRLWAMTGIDPSGGSGSWYKEAGAGMGATLNITSGLNAYTLTDRGTWLSFQNRGELEVVLEGSPPLFNPYGVIPVNPAKHPHVQFEAAEKLVNWLTGPLGQAAIAGFKVNGQQLFFPNARPQ
jgi:tungstate transport system substrate-binding protein